MIDGICVAANAYSGVFHWANRLTAHAKVSGPCIPFANLSEFTPYEKRIFAVSGRFDPHQRMASAAQAKCGLDFCEPKVPLDDNPGCGARQNTFSLPTQSTSSGQKQDRRFSIAGFESVMRAVADEASVCPIGVE